MEDMTDNRPNTDQRERIIPAALTGAGIDVDTSHVVDNVPDTAEIIAARLADRGILPPVHILLSQTADIPSFGSNRMRGAGF